MTSPFLPEGKFWIPKPCSMGARGWSLLIPSIITAIGLCAFAVLAFSFTELATLPTQFRTTLVLIGAFSLAFGGELGTVFSVIEIYRKPQRSLWDWSALIVSVAATFGSFLLAFAALLGVNASWGPTIRMYGPIFQGILVALDGYGLFVEFGQYLNSYDQRMREWRAQYEGAISELMGRKLRLNQSVYKQQVDSVERKPVDSASQVDSGLVDNELIANIPDVDSVQPAEDDTQPLTVINIDSVHNVDSVHNDSVQLQNTNVDDYKQARIDMMLTLYQADPRTPATRMAEHLGVSRTTVYNYLNELEEEKVIHRNGDGVEVLHVH